MLFKNVNLLLLIVKVLFVKIKMGNHSSLQGRPYHRRTGAQQEHMTVDY